MSADLMERLHRFNVAHSGCGSIELLVEPLTEADADFVRDPEGPSRFWFTARCAHCGATIREPVDWERLKADSLALIAAAGIEPADLWCTLAAGDQAALDAMSNRIKAAPTTLATLAAIRKAIEPEAHN